MKEHLSQSTHKTFHLAEKCYRVGWINYTINWNTRNEWGREIGTNVNLGIILCISLPLSRCVAVPRNPKCKQVFLFGSLCYHVTLFLWIYTTLNLFYQFRCILIPLNDAPSNPNALVNACICEHQSNILWKNPGYHKYTTVVYKTF